MNNTASKKQDNNLFTTQPYEKGRPHFLAFQTVTSLLAGLLLSPCSKILKPQIRQTKSRNQNPLPRFHGFKIIED